MSSIHALNCLVYNALLFWLEWPHNLRRSFKYMWQSFTFPVAKITWYVVWYDAFNRVLPQVLVLCFLYEFHLNNVSPIVFITLLRWKHSLFYLIYQYFPHHGLHFFMTNTIFYLSTFTVHSHCATATTMANNPSNDGAYVGSLKGSKEQCPEWVTWILMILINDDNDGIIVASECVLNIVNPSVRLDLPSSESNKTYERKYV